MWPSCQPLCLALLHLGTPCPISLFLQLVLQLLRLLLITLFMVLFHLLLWRIYLFILSSQISLQSFTKLCLGRSFFLKTPFGLIDVPNLQNLSLLMASLTLTKCILHHPQPLAVHLYHQFIFLTVLAGKLVLRARFQLANPGWIFCYALTVFLFSDDKLIVTPHYLGSWEGLNCSIV